MHYTYLKNSYVGEVANIISTNYKNARLALPILSDKYENIEMHIKQIQKYVGNNNFIVAIEANKVTGFINGFSINEFKGIDKHLAASPIYLHNHISENYVDEYGDWLKTEGNMLWVAEVDHKIIGYLKTNTTEINMDELDDGYTMGINGAYVLPEYRGHHIMSKLLNIATEWAISKGLKRCSTDFESANIEGRHFWLRHFTPYCYSMIRRIDERNHLNLINIEK